MFKRFTTGLAVGYVLGARAGDKRYKQLVSLAQKASELPQVSRALEAGKGVADEHGRDLLEMWKTRASERVDQWLHPDEQASDEEDPDDQDADDQDAGDHDADDQDAGDEDSYDEDFDDEDPDEEPRARDTSDDDSEDADTMDEPASDGDTGDGDMEGDDHAAASTNNRSRHGDRNSHGGSRRPRPRPSRREQANGHRGKPRLGQLAAAAIDRGRVD